MELYDTTLSLHEKLEILSDAAKYDVACTSSGIDRRGKKGYLAIPALPESCHSLCLADGPLYLSAKNFTEQRLHL